MLNYFTHYPSGYKANKNKKWPIIFFLHGAGERGTNLELVKKHGPIKYIRENKLPFIVVAPQCDHAHAGRVIHSGDPKLSGDSTAVSALGARNGQRGSQSRRRRTTVTL